MMMTSESAAACRAASRSSRAVSTLTTFDAGRRRDVHVGGQQPDPGAGVAGGGGQRHALLAGGAVAEEPDGVQGFAGAAGADRDGEPGQRHAGGDDSTASDVRQRRPSRAPAGAPARARAASKIASGSGSRPGPESDPVSRPLAGSSTVTPRLRRVSTLAWVAGCCHISVCMAGAISTGQPPAISRVLVRRSLAWPVAARASRSAVAGATTISSASWPRRTWLTVCTSSKTLLLTGCPDSASHVATPTKRVAASVGMTVTSWPASVKSRRSDATL